MESVRPCLRCDALVDDALHYCSGCGSYMGKVALVISRPAAAVQSPEIETLANILQYLFVASAALSVAAAVTAAMASFA